MNKGERVVLFVLVVCLVFAPAQALTAGDSALALERTGGYLLGAVPDPGVDAVGGEWTVLGLARSGLSVPEGYFAGYYNNLTAHVRQVDGVLDSRRYTEYARVVLALTAIGEDPTDVAGYDLLAPLGDFDGVMWQGVNGPVFALLALDAGDYDVPEAPEGATQATRQMYLDAILDLQCADGGFSLDGTSGDPDVTAMALQALAKYVDRSRVAGAVERALDCLSGLQTETGGFASWGEENLESTAQVLVALCELGIGPEDSRLVKNGRTVADALMDYALEGGEFCHVAGGDASLMSTEQGLCALAAYSRHLSGGTGLYDMTDVDPGTAEGPDLFDDVPWGHWAYAYIADLVDAGVVDGVSETSFAPGHNVKRAEVAKMLAVMSGDNPPQPTGRFGDVAADDWYAAHIEWAFGAGVMTGRTATLAAPEDQITRQELAAMVLRYADYMDIQLPETAAGDTFPDDGLIHDYAREAVYALARAGIIEGRDTGRFDPLGTANRAEAAKMLAGVLALQ